MENKPVIPARDDPEFGTKLRAIRHALGLTEDQFADNLGMGKSTLYSWETSRFAGQLPSERLYTRAKAFLENGTTFSDKKIGNASTGPKKPMQAIVTPVGIDLHHITEGDLVRELQRRGWKVTLEM